jgi:DNA uptake protein ComE-like DNA-binding protein
MKLATKFVVALVVSSLGSSSVWAHAAEAKKPASRASRLDLNSATLDKLKAIKGLDEAQAKKIIAGRPYKRRSELVFPEDPSGGDVR